MTRALVILNFIQLLNCRVGSVQVAGNYLDHQQLFEVCLGHKAGAALSLMQSIAISRVRVGSSDVKYWIHLWMLLDPLDIYWVIEVEVVSLR